MATKNDLIELADSLGIDENGIDVVGNDMSFWLPVGKCWSFEGESTHVLVVTQNEGESLSEAIADGLERMELGIEDCQCHQCVEAMANCFETEQDPIDKDHVWSFQ